MVILTNTFCIAVGLNISVVAWWEVNEYSIAIGH
jgi:hypothetical protein